MRDSENKTRSATDARARLYAAWYAKIDLRFDDAAALLTQIKLELAIPTGHLTENQVVNILLQGGELECEVLSLSAELSRCIGDDGYAKQLLEWIETAAKSTKRNLNFWTFYARGMACYTSGDFTLAFEEYLRARDRVTSPTQKLIADVNLLFTLENLGLPYSDAIEEVQSDLKRTQEPSVVTRSESQLAALKLRELFRDGEFRELFETERKRAAGPVDQGYYFSLWVSQLPYHAFHRDLTEKELSRFAMGPSYQHHKAYRQRTLQGMIHPDEKKLTKPSEFVERFYLWVWRWLKTPESGAGEKILLLLREFIPQQFIHRLTVEDHELFANGLLWLSFFDPSSEVPANRLLGKLKPSSRAHYPVLKLESLVIHYLIAIRDGKEALAAEYFMSLQNNPLWNSKELEFKEMVEYAMGKSKVLPKHLSDLAEVLFDSFRRSQAGRISVNLGSGEIRPMHGGEPTISLSMAAAFHLLRLNPRVPCDRFSRVCFQIPDYDALIHGPKIQNLLSRMKGLVGDQLRFGLKSGHVFAEGDWGGIRFKKAMPLSGLDQDLENLMARLFKDPVEAQSASVSPRLSESKRLESAWSQLPWTEGVTRSQVEAWLGRPRSSVNRILKNWLEEGKIIREGKARSSRYLLKEKS